MRVQANTLVLASMSKFYIIRNLPAEHHDMLDGPRIVEEPDHFLTATMALDVGEGPFSSLKSLRQESVIFQELLATDPKRAEKIGLDNFIVRPAARIVFPTGLDPEYEKIIYRIMQHSSNGTIGSKSVKGIHLFDGDRVRVTEMIEPQNSLGVFTARVEVLNRNTGRWIPKKQATTFFPTGWGLQKLIFECYDAFSNKTQASPTVYEGRTTSGIKVTFCYTEDGTFTTVFPVYETV